MHHELEIWPVFFQRHVDGVKPWEIRKNDRNFDTGDIVRLREWDPTHEKYTGHWIQGEILFVMADVMGLKEGYCAFTFKATVVGFDEVTPFPQAAKGTDENLPNP